MTHYEVSPDRIEYGEGVFERKVDNLDMFRVVDIKLRRNVLDCVVGVGRTTDGGWQNRLEPNPRTSRA